MKSKTTKQQFRYEQYSKYMKGEITKQELSKRLEILPLSATQYFHNVYYPKHKPASKLKELEYKQKRMNATVFSKYEEAYKKALLACPPKEIMAISDVVKKNYYLNLPCLGGVSLSSVRRKAVERLVKKPVIEALKKGARCSVLCKKYCEKYQIKPKTLYCWSALYVNPYNLRYAERDDLIVEEIMSKDKTIKDLQGKFLKIDIYNALIRKGVYEKYLQRVNEQKKSDNDFILKNYNYELSQRKNSELLGFSVNRIVRALGSHIHDSTL